MSRAVFSSRFAAFAALLALGGCLAPAADRGDPAARYTISIQRPNEVLTGRPVRNLAVGRNANRGEVERTLAANPGLAEALVRNGVDLRMVTALRVGPTGVVEVYTRGR
ncbi:hypothetical protein GCM10011390_18180 [Aureimonas endophytica]|uniref:Uncharacterized protein n=1 Tax=Aureimonas endophytica TaxID=2027858 RepID=A0A917E3D3_9HYPH|nr:hypothetical protein [Aureimonas endophytica]GGD99757.1 hypothetical protein GCM10011390_18180 [Aureimonas endophytica]